MLSIHSTSKKTGAVISYVYLALNSISSILLTPFLLKRLGVDEYGIYQMIYSIGSYILILDLGIGTVMVRYISEYRARGDSGKERNFSGMLAIITAAICFVVFLIGIMINYNLESIFKGLSTEDYIISHRMFYLMIYLFVMTIMDHYVQGVLSAYERFVFIKVTGVIRISLALLMTIFFVQLGWGSVGIVFANALSITIMTVIDILYAFRFLNFKIEFTHLDKTILLPVSGLMLAMLLQAVVGHINSSADKTILGIMCNPVDVTIYSIAASIITLFNTIPSVISGLFQPQVTSMVVKGTNGRTLTDLVIRVGRWQFLLCGAFMSCMFLFGMDFLNLWLGGRLTENEKSFSLLIMLIILPFNMIPLIQNVCISILNAYDKRLYRSLILFLVCLINILLTIEGVNIWGPIGAPIGTALSYFIGYVIILNIYYSKSLKLEITRMFKGILSRSWICILSCTLICFPLTYWSIDSWSLLFIKGCIYIIVFSTLIYCFALNEEEKGICDGYINTIHYIFFRNQKKQ